MATLRCPICQQPFELTQSKSLPFCSERCRNIDLGRWLGETYTFRALRSEDVEDDDADDSAADAPTDRR